MTDDELDLVETETLVDALKRRFDVVLIGTVSHLNAEAEAREIYWRGGFCSALGLLAYMDKRFTSMVFDKASEKQDDDED